MYPTLSHFFQEVFGWNIPLPIQTYGFFVALAFLSGLWFFAREFKRKEKEGVLKSIQKKVLIGEAVKPTELIFSGIIGFIIDDPQDGQKSQCSSTFFPHL